MVMGLIGQVGIENGGGPQGRKYQNKRNDQIFTAEPTHMGPFGSIQHKMITVYPSHENNGPPRKFLSRGKV